MERHTTKDHGTDRGRGNEKEFSVKVFFRRRFLVLSMLSSALTAFAVGQIARRIILLNNVHELLSLSMSPPVIISQQPYQLLARTMLLESRSRNRRRWKASTTQREEEISYSSKSSTITSNSPPQQECSTTKSSDSGSNRQCVAGCSDSAILESEGLSDATSSTSDCSYDYDYDYYSESVVHPAMFTHSHPKRVGIVCDDRSRGSDCCNTLLREVLKHNTVEKIVVIIVIGGQTNNGDGDGDNSSRSKENSEYQDPRIDVEFVDDIKKFVSNNGSNKWDDDGEFDVVIMDILLRETTTTSTTTTTTAPTKEEEDGPSSGDDWQMFLKSLYNALTKDGILVMTQLGGTKAESSETRTIKTLIDVGFESIRTYDIQAHCRLRTQCMIPRQVVEVLISFKDFDSRARWFANSALVDLDIRRRARGNDGDDSRAHYPFQIFDGPTMQTFLYPSKASEISFCRQNPQTKACIDGHGFDPERVNLPASTTVEIKQSSLGPKAGRGVFAKIDIPRDSYVGLDTLIPAVHFDYQSYSMVTNFYRIPPYTYYDYYAEYWGVSLETYIHGYGHLSSFHGLEEVYVDPDFHCFVNHACNGTNNVGHTINITEFNVNEYEIPSELRHLFRDGDLIYNPAAERQVHFYSSAIPKRDIPKGQELFDNYLGMSGLRIQGWENDVVTLRQQCQGTGMGQISQYEGL